MRLTAAIATAAGITTAVIIGTSSPMATSAADPPTPVRTARSDLVALVVAIPETTTTTTMPVPAEVLPEPVSDPGPASSPGAGGGSGGGSGCDGTGWAIPTSLVWRESRCDFGAVNPGGCGGYGCVGAYQFDARHFSGWANGQAACGDLDWTIPDDQHECARRLSRDGTNLAPWGG